ncbi:MAG: HRDC domain-containing protein, partial [Clostridiales bacterium]|nr:HRDC domain-containing protein [Clostridiales bacterium]
MKDELYKKLYDYREKLRDRENKHTPTAIISDEALKGLAHYKPTELEDMLKIKGIGNVSVQKYGLGFLNILQDEQKPIKLTMMRSEVKDTLKNLQSRLTNLNRRNRMLYLTKPASGRALDLCTKDAKRDGAVIDSLLSYGGKPTVVCSGGEDLYTQYNRLIRAATSSARETGSNTLYAGYPFVIGKCGNDKNSFNIAAPLVLFPVVLENTGGKIVMTLDPDRDITYNSTLVLCHNKFSGKGSLPLPSCTVDTIIKTAFVRELVAFYAQNGITVDVDDSAAGLVKLAQYTDKTFPKFATGGYRLVNNAVVGLFPMNSGAMQKDFDDIIESGVMPQTLTTLLEGADEIEDMYGDSEELYDGAIPVDSEGFIDYINELNVSQERAIEKSATERTLVMQGPPGTGKSQTITSMITDAVDDGKNVLVVSQKHAALSVIYSRLGLLSKYALFIDDPKDKNAFYGRLKAMFDAEEVPAPFNDIAYSREISSVDSDLANLDKLAAALETDDFGVPMISIYGDNLYNPFKAAERTVSAADETAVFKCNVPEALLDCGYEKITSARAYLEDNALFATLDKYYSLSEKYDWLVDFKQNLSSADVAALLSELDGMNTISGKFKYRRALKSFLKANFGAAYTRAVYKRFKKAPTELYDGLKSYDEFYNCKLTADSLDFCTRLYYGTLYTISKELDKPTADICGKLKDYCAYTYIDRFENAHRDVINSISGYAATVGRICSSIDRKRSLTKDKTMNVLKKEFGANIGQSKRRGDMLRAIDGKRRPAIGKFVEKFDFELFRGVRIFLMTPEAVSEVLPLRNDLFELLVFDEASQIYVERGIPAIARARRLVVCGDHKQLRPSSLGDGRITVDEEEESDAVLEEESLLDIARFKFPEVMLSYHYRSRYEELIAFSNAAFYGGRLNISPNPVPPEAPPIKIHKVNGKWEDRVNRAEADAVLELISEYLTSSAEKPIDERETLGVITFNAKQRDYILALIDKKCDAEPEFKTLYTEAAQRRKDGEDFGLFIK